MFIPSKAPCPSPFTNDAARWFRTSDSTPGDDPCRNGAGGPNRKRLVVVVTSGGTTFAADVQSSIGACVMLAGVDVCSDSTYITEIGDRFYINVWGAYDAGLWTSSIAFTLRATTGSVVTLGAFVQTSTLAEGRIFGTSASTVTPRTANCSTSLVGCNTWTVTMYDDGTFTIT